MKTRLRLPGEAWPSRPRTRARYLRVVVHTYSRARETFGQMTDWCWRVGTSRYVRSAPETICATGIAPDRSEAMRQALEWAVANAAVIEFGDRDIRRWAKRASR